MACHPDKPHLGLEVVIRDNGGRLVVAQALLCLGYLSAEASETIVLMVGLQLLEGLRLPKVWVEMDAEFINCPLLYHLMRSSMLRLFLQ